MSFDSLYSLLIPSEGGVVAFVTLTFLAFFKVVEKNCKNKGVKVGTELKECFDAGLDFIFPFLLVPVGLLLMGGVAILIKNWIL